MNAKEKLRDSLRAYDQIEPAEDSWERINARADGNPLPFWRGHAVLAGLAALMALGAIVGVRLVADRNRGQVRLVTPVVSPTGVPSPTLPTPSASPSGSPSASPSPTPANKVHYVSEDGVWELFYPKSWFGPGVEKVVGDFANYRSSPEEVGLPIKVDLVVDIYSVEKDGTLDDFLAERCKERGGLQILECKKVEINGRTWGWILAYSEAADEPAMVLGIHTIVNGTIYHAVGYVFAKSGHEPGIAQIAEVLESLVLNV